MKKTVSVAVEKITPEVQDALVSTGTKTQHEIEELLRGYSEITAKAAVGISLSSEFQPTVSTGWMGKINPTLLRVLEVGGVVMFFSNVIAGLGVLILDRIPMIKNLLPHIFMKNIVLSTIEKSFRDSLQAASDNFIHQLTDSIDAVREGIRASFEEIYQSKILPYNEAIKKYRNEALDEAQAQQVRDEITALSKMLNELGA